MEEKIKGLEEKWSQVQHDSLRKPSQAQREKILDKQLHSLIEQLASKQAQAEGLISEIQNKEQELEKVNGLWRTHECGNTVVVISMFPFVTSHTPSANPPSIPAIASKILFKASSSWFFLLPPPAHHPLLYQSKVIASQFQKHIYLIAELQELDQESKMSMASKSRLLELYGGERSGERSDDFLLLKSIFGCCTWSNSEVPTLQTLSLKGSPGEKEKGKPMDVRADSNQNAESTSTCSDPEVPILQTRSLKDSPDHSRAWEAIPKPKGHSNLDYSRWERVEDDSSEDEEDEDEECQTQYRFRVKDCLVYQS
ncbi:hypothetical protein NE237_020360 [Protea cynaroides]|uniref:Uncharacterized protein n=1 Tax=Protea cynaroides TaxID=273540 RepID=A0A9Q0H732_9MAGN|nr:hypothetical protein NE237_020360 [Protea cynaroides]